MTPSPSRRACRRPPRPRRSDPSGSRRWTTSGLARPSGDPDLGGEGAALLIRVGAVAVEVEPGLPDRHDAGLRAELLDRQRRRLVEAVGAVRVAADRGEHPLIRLRRADGSRVRVLAKADGQDPIDPGVAGRGDQLRLGRLAEPEVRVSVDHQTSVWTTPPSDRSHKCPLGAEIRLDEIEVAGGPAVQRREALEPAEDEEERVSLGHRSRARLGDSDQPWTGRRIRHHGPSTVSGADGSLDAAVLQPPLSGHLSLQLHERRAGARA